MTRIILITLFLTAAFGFSARAQTGVLRPSIVRIVNKLRSEPTLHLGAPVGYAAIPETNNRYFKLYSRLKKNATTEELLELTEDTSKYILLYAFEILHSHTYSGLKDIFLVHQYDTSEVWQAGGCTGVVWKVNSYMLHLLSPQTNKESTTYLTHREYADLFRQIGY